MKQQRVVALLASASVLYAVASVSAGGASLDAGAIALALVGLACALAPLTRTGGEPGEGRDLTLLLTSALSFLLAAELASGVHPLLAELTFAVATPLVGALVLRLALSVPDTPVRLVRYLSSEVLLRLVGLVALALGVVAALPPLWLAGRPLIAAHWLAYAPPAFALSCLVIATVLRLFRRRLGSDARALSANLWATLGSALGLALVSAMLSARLVLHSPRVAEQVILALAAGLFALGHAWLVSPRRVVVASQWARELLALTLAFGVAAAGFVVAAPWWAADPLSRLLLCALVLASFALALAAFRRLSRFALAPHRGRLLDALSLATRDSLGADSYEDFAARLLRPLRRSALSPEAAPLLLAFHPAREVRLDAAGQPHVSERALSSTIVARLVQLGGESVVRDDLAARLVRRPELRDLVAALDELDALCVVPLVAQGELEGALVLARGARRDPLTLEELTALASFASYVEATAAVFLRAERANQRFAQAAAERSELKSQVDELREECEALRAESTVLRAGSAALTPRPEPVAYSEAMRRALGRIERAAGDDVTVLLVGEPGTHFVPLARLVHDASGRAEAPFVVADCAQLPAEDALAALFGSRQGPGWLELAGDGTLVLLDVPALVPEAQRSLARALSERRATPCHGGASYSVRARVVATARRELAPLVLSGAIVAELGRWFEPAACDVPPLRERREDIESLVLKALDRVSRVSGRHVLGVAPDALRALVEYDWPGNDSELELAVERAASRTTGTRIALDDLPPLPERGVAGTPVEQERELLRLALEKAGGSRTRAARALGLKRTTLLEKLKRLGLDGQDGPTNH